MKVSNTGVFSAVSSLFFGLTLPILSAKLILRSPRLIIWSIAPVLITLSLYILAFAKVQPIILNEIHSLLLNHGLNSQSWIMTLTSGVSYFLLFLVGAISFSLIASVIACPFNDFLAEEAERHTQPPIFQSSNLSLTGRARLIALDFAKSLAAIALSGVALLISWVPLLNVLALILTFLLICFQFLNYPQTRRGQGILDGVLFIRRNFFACAGFGASLTFLFSIPFISSLFLPLAVVGGTVLFSSGARSR